MNNLKSPYFINQVRFSEPTREYKKLNSFWALVIIICVAIVYSGAVIRFYSLPNVRNEQDPRNFGFFIAARAKRTLEQLDELGARVVGTPANERDTVTLLTEIIDDIKSTASSAHVIESDVQEVSGGVVLGPSASFYESIHNVVVKFAPNDGKNHSALLINAHFDTVPTSPGGGDDGLMIAVMLEVLRVLSHSRIPLKHSIIFLFNGAEENSLQGSHAFITQHHWASNVRAFINLDALGNGGKEILFQNGPHHAWLAKYYARYAEHPYANSMADELFRLNLIPSDTDFRIFRDFGHIPGLDLAHCLNDYVYHTQYDTMANIPDETYQHTGDNILAITRAIANSPELEDPSVYADGNAVFYDFLGWFIVYYTEDTGVIINLSICTLALGAILFSLIFIRISSRIAFIEVIFKLFVSICVQTVSIGLATGITIGIAFLLDSIDYSLSWYSQPWLLFALYYCPFVFVLGVLPSIYLNSRFCGIPLHFGVQLLLHAQCIIVIIAATLMTIFEIRSTFILIFAIMFYAISVIFNWILSMYAKPFIWIIPHLIFQIIPFAFYAYLSMITNSLFVPLSGRLGADFNAELFIAFFQTGFALLMAGFIVPIFSLIKRTKIILSLFVIIFIIFFVMVFTSICFPYTAETAPQRHSIYHTRRRFHNFDGSIRKEDAGFYILTWDRKSPGIIKKFLGEHMRLLSADEDCGQELMCGLPHYSSGMRSFVSSGFWVKSNNPNIKHYPNLTLISMESTNNLHRYSFRMTGTRQTQIFIEPLGSVRLINWSLPTEIPPKSNKQSDAYYLMIRFGGYHLTKDFWLDFLVPDDHVGMKFQIALVGHHQNRDNMLTSEFKDLLKFFPEYTALLATQSSFESWRF